MLTSDQINDLHRLYVSEKWPIRKTWNKNCQCRLLPLHTADSLNRNPVGGTPLVLIPDTSLILKSNSSIYEPVTLVRCTRVWRQGATYVRPSKQMRFRAGIISAK